MFCCEGPKKDENGRPIKEIVEEIGQDIWKSEGQKEKFIKDLKSLKEKSAEAIDQAVWIVEQHQFCDKMVVQSIVNPIKDKRNQEAPSNDVPASFVPAKMIEDSAIETSQQGKDSRAQKSKRWWLWKTNDE